MHEKFQTLVLGFSNCTGFFKRWKKETELMSVNAVGKLVMAVCTSAADQNSHLVKTPKPCAFSFQWARRSEESTRKRAGSQGAGRCVLMKVYLLSFSSSTCHVYFSSVSSAARELWGSKVVQMSSEQFT